MENATKALIMAGAILIAILIISAGIIVFNSTRGVTEESKAAGDLMAIETYNSQFTKYCGERVKGSEVTNLINFVGTYTARNGEAPTLDGTTTGINPAKDYKVTIEERNSDGKVTIIKISDI